jgi:hypothetical protein
MEGLDSIDDRVLCSLCEIIEESVAEKFTKTLIIMISRIDIKCYVRQNWKIEVPSGE